MIKDKILNPEELEEELKRVARWGLKIALVTGCFDILHRGHVFLLEDTRMKFPGHEIWVGLNSDMAVRALKGETRPIHNFESRAMVMAALQCVDVVFEIGNVRVADAIRMVKPKLWVKGGDYTLETLNQDERKAAEEVGSMIHFVVSLQGYSTTEILKRL